MNVRFCLFASLLTFTLTAGLAQQKSSKTQIILLGSAHFGQESFYKDAPMADLFQENRQREVDQVNAKLARFKPDLILIEREPGEQAQVDSLYGLYKSNRLSFRDLSHGRAEQYQIAYALAKQLNLRSVFGVDYYIGTSNRILNQGQHIDYYLNELKAFSDLGNSVIGAFRAGTMRLPDFLIKLNSPQVLQETYRVMYITPAKVRQGKLNTKDPLLDSTRISSDYVGADFITYFYSRELRIYSNIVNRQLAEKKQRILVVMGQRHAAVLTKLFENDPDYEIVPVEKYLR
ncbi:DUF5694 domain-containing protein [Spirosoma sp. 209]|uniref:DUF5694 domain-containing protein n=1 Tax=Spirosoma sp. 209 TaxID=1955701 RepID=UPI00098D22F0|nr:DUF5694 domain-containing protein [Spirosoma sp. 209]